MEKLDILNENEYELVLNTLKNKCKILAFAIGKFNFCRNTIFESPKIALILLTKNNEERKYSIRMLNLDDFEQIDQFNILNESHYKLVNSELHLFVNDDCTVFLSFVSSLQFENFGNNVKKVFIMKDEIEPTDETSENHMNNSQSTDQISLINTDIKGLNDKIVLDTKDDLTTVSKEKLPPSIKPRRLKMNQENDLSKEHMKSEFREQKIETELLVDRTEDLPAVSKTKCLSAVKSQTLNMKQKIKLFEEQGNIDGISTPAVNNHVPLSPKKLPPSIQPRPTKINNNNKVEFPQKIINQIGGETKTDVPLFSGKLCRNVSVKDFANNLNQKLYKINSHHELIKKLERNSEEIELSDVEFTEVLMDGQFQLHEKLFEKLPDKFLFENISKEIIERAIATNKLKLIKLLFSKANGDVQNQVQEDILFYHAINDNEVDFETLQNHNVVSPKSFENGENLLTNLIKSNKPKFVWKLLSSNNSHLYINLKNSKLRSPLQVAIEMNSLDIVNFFIYESSQLNDEDENGITALELIFQKMNDLTDIGLKSRMMSVAKSIVNKGGDIYKITSKGYRIIDLYKNSSFAAEIETFYDNFNINRNSQESKKICSICFNNEINCVYRCGHTFCMTCGEKMFCCPVCRSEPTNPTRIFL